MHVFTRNPIVYLFIAILFFCSCSGGESQISNFTDPLPPGFDLALKGAVKVFEYKNNDKIIAISSNEVMYSSETGVVNFKNVESEYYVDNRLKYTASGKTGNYYDGDKILFLEDDIMLKSVEGATATCRKGRYDLKNEILDLFGDVVAKNTDGYTIETANLNYSFNEEVVVSTSEVKITGDGLTITGIGLRASNKDGIVEVKQNVKLEAFPKVLREQNPPR